MQLILSVPYGEVADGCPTIPTDLPCGWHGFMDKEAFDIVVPVTANDLEWWLDSPNN